MTGCSTRHLLNVLTILQAGSAPARVPTLPGDTHADPATQKAALEYAQAVAVRAAPPNCKQEMFVNTEFDGYTGLPDNTVTDGRDTRAWRENWSLFACGTTYVIDDDLQAQRRRPPAFRDQPGQEALMGPQVVTFGCRLNIVESEAIRAAARRRHRGRQHLRRDGGGRAAGRQAVRRLARERPGSRIVATGCAVQLDPQRWAAMPGVARVLGNADKLRAAAWSPGAPSQVSPPGAAPTPAPDGFAAHTRGFVQVQAGCDHRCTFCAIPLGRGPSRSVPPAAIAAQVAALAARGVAGRGAHRRRHREPCRRDRRRGHHGAATQVPGLRRLRLSSLDPAALDPALWRLLADEPRLMPHLHLSLQSGADLVLKRMRRRHGRADALAAIARARRLRPGLAIGADLIAGFPTETDALAAETERFVAEAEIPYLHVFPYSERPGTPAARMPAVPVPLRRERAARLREAAAGHAARFHAAQLGRVVSVLAERDGRGRTEQFAPVRLAAPPGAIVAARVVATAADGLLAVAA